MFEKSIIEQLDASLAPERIATRKQGGTDLKYLEGYDIIDRANQIFGYDGWKYETDYVDVMVNGLGQIAKAKVKVEVWNGQTWISRSDIGLNPVVIKNGESEPKPEALDMAIKGAVTDALKRSFRTFGNQFGNSLYDKDYVIPNQGTTAGVSPANHQGSTSGQNQAPIAPPDNGLTPPAPDAQGKVCPTCGANMTHKSGTNSNGKPYSGWFCPNSNKQGCKPIWDSTK